MRGPASHLCTFMHIMVALKYGVLYTVVVDEYVIWREHFIFDSILVTYTLLLLQPWSH